MFNLVKWAFKLGQQTERHRIATILHAERSDLKYGEYGTGNEKDLREKAIAASDWQIARIIRRITEPQYQDPEVSSYSLLFPKEDK